MSKKDYPELEGKTFKFIKENGKELMGKIIGCNYDVGISGINVDDSDDYLMCLIGPASPSWDCVNKASKDFYKTLFYIMIAQIKRGCIDINLISKYRRFGEDYIPNHDNITPSVEICPFGQ